jgi:Mg-chelatase subunit ChlD
VSDCDRLALVKFDDKTDIVLDWTVMDQQGIDEFLSAQKQLVSRGGTCFLPVFEACFGTVLKEPCPGRSRSVLFISDGAPNETDNDILRMINAQLTSSNLTIVSAGFGTGTKSGLMSAIAQCGCGPFVYIREEQDIPQQLGRIWAAVAHTTLAAAFAIVRPVGGARVTAVEGAFGSAELSLRPDGRLSWSKL